MDRGIWATWYDLPAEGKEEYISWLHEVHFPGALSRPGYLWAVHVENVRTPEREEAISRNLTHTSDLSIPKGNDYLVLFGAASPHTFVSPSWSELRSQMTIEENEMLGRRIAPRSCIFVEVDRVDGPEVGTRAPGITPGPAIQLGSFNINNLENEDELSTWYARSRLPLMAGMTGCVGRANWSRSLDGLSTQFCMSSYHWKQFSVTSQETLQSGRSTSWETSSTPQVPRRWGRESGLKGERSVRSDKLR